MHVALITGLAVAASTTTGLFLLTPPTCENDPEGIFEMPGLENSPDNKDT